METSHHNFSFSELIPGLPDELGLECLTRLPYQTHRVASRVCRRWRSLIESREFHHLRRTNGHAHKLACLVHALDKTSNRGVSDLPKRGGETAVSFGIAVFDSTDSSWHPIDPVPKYPDGLPLFCRIASCEGKLVVIGGWDPQTYEPVTDIFVFDFVENRWREGRKMPEKRSFFAVGSDSCRIYVAGGHDENKNALSSAWAYDVDRDEWNELTRMSRERDESEGVVIGGEFWVVSGYGTESQGAFDSSAEVYNSESKTWRRVEGVWEKGRCPRGCLGVWMEGERRLASWGELDSAVRVGTCGVALGDHQAVVAGSPCQDGTHGFHLVELKEGQNGKFEKISVPSEFCGPVQSACCVEI
ncbi:F-box/kelch-repeat protein [Morus notabilis]|uniref:F-box/kelch-repeat protein n=1 Tax=Morus notabilis TaxID=981085 RepID=W9S1L2_9ROSA|nr:F-box/kelch-repeat protein At2g44130 [Morus notabilis]EXC04166.1 F-box/kelch-repeat protein [Morus notabilis]